jgi:hypothetical protein
VSVHEHAAIITSDPKEVVRRIEARAEYQPKTDSYKTHDGGPFYMNKFDDYVGLLSFNYMPLPAGAILAMLRSPKCFEWMTYSIENDLLFEGDLLAWR